MKRRSKAAKRMRIHPANVLAYGCFLLSIFGGATGSYAQTDWFPASKLQAPTCEGCATGCVSCGHWNASHPEQQRTTAALYNRYCVRCHGIDGRGVCDIPDVPDFTNAVWQSSRTDEQLARLTYEGRGAVMPAFRGTLTMDESWAMARYLRRFTSVGSAPVAAMSAVPYSDNPTADHYQMSAPDSLVVPAKPANTGSACANGACARNPSPNSSLGPVPGFNQLTAPGFNSVFEAPSIGGDEANLGKPAKSPPHPALTMTPPNDNEAFNPIPTQTPEFVLTPLHENTIDNTIENTTIEPTTEPTPSMSFPIVDSPMGEIPMIESQMDGEPQPAHLPMGDFVKPLEPTLEISPRLDPPTPEQFKPFQLIAPESGTHEHQQMSHGSLLPPMKAETISKPVYPSTSPSSFRIFPNHYPSTKNGK